MDDLSLTNSTKRISEPLKVVWFEFLLNPSLLETHLQKENADPSATDLIIQFLANINQGSANNESSNNGVVNEGNESGEAAPERQKNLALKLLALKAAAILNWDLTIFEQKLPMTMQESILVELQKTTPPATDTISTTSPDALFGQILYHRWCLRIVNLDRYPVRGPKGLNILLPCQSDLSIVPAEQIEATKKKIQEQLPESSKFLEQVLKVNCSFRMPRMACFGIITEQVAQPCHNWENGLKLTSDEVKCQVAYDLGSYFFFQQNYGQAYDCFQKSYELFAKFKKSVYCTFDESQFKGYLKASTYIFLGKAPTTKFHSQSLEERLQMASLNDHKETVQILLEDNLKREIPISLRSFVEMEILRQGERMNEMYHQVAVLNAVRKVIAGQVVVPHILYNKKVEKLTLLLSDALNAIIPGLSPIQKTFLKNFTRQICSQHEAIRTKLVSCGVVESLFTEEEALEFSKSLIKVPPKLLAENLFSNFTQDKKIEISTRERRLLATSNPTEIIELVKQLKGVPRHLLSSKWELNNSIVQMVRSVVRENDADVIFLLLSKASDLLAAKKYQQARVLYQQIQVPCNRLNWFLSTKILETELQECLGHPVYKPFPEPTEVLHKLNAHFNQQDQDLTIIELGCALCLNIRKWSFLTDIDDRGEPFFRLSKVFSNVCNDMYSNTWRRSLYKELWDAMLPFFFKSNSGNSHKRTSSGAIKELQRDMPRAIMPRHVFGKFVTKLTDTMIIGILISCLSKFYNILKDETSQDIYLEYQNVWPAVITNASLYEASLVMDMLQTIVNHGLSIHATHSSWLRTLGDLAFALKHYSIAMKHYLSSANIISDYFSQPLPRPPMDDSFYLRMMTCCSLLNNHTQAAILGQFLEEPNYTTIFKSLNEKVCFDSCDMYYSFIWDLTVLEFLINLHHRRGEYDRSRQATKFIGLLELNGNNNEEIQRESSNIRKSEFLRVLAKQYIL